MTGPGQEREARVSRPIWLILSLVGGLAACQGREEAPPEVPEADLPPAARTSPVASIIRPELDAAPEPEELPAPLELTIGFPAGGAALDQAAVATLDRVLESPQLAGGWPIVLRGHSDSVGHDGDNLAVSRLRGEAVADWLVEHGVAEGRIRVIALGEMRPVAPNAKEDGTPDEAGRAANRRVELEIALPPAPAGAPGDAPPIMQATAPDASGS